MKRLLLVSLILCTLLTYPTLVYGQNVDPWQKSVTLNVKDAPLKDVLEDISRQTGLSYLIEKRTAEALADAKVAVDIASAPVTTALEKILSPLKASYRQEGTIIVVAMDTAARLKKPVSLQVTNTSLEAVLEQLSRSVGFDFVADVDVHMGWLKVQNYSIKNVPFETALSALLDAMGVSCERRGDTFYLSVKNTPTGPYSARPTSAPGGGFGPANNINGQNATYQVKHIDPRWIVNAIKKIPGIANAQYTTQSVGEGREISTVGFVGNSEANKKAIEMAQSMDVPWPTKVVELKMDIKNTFQAKGKPLVVTVNSPNIMDPDGSEASIEIASLKPESTKGQPVYDARFSVTITPKVQPDGRVWLKGMLNSKRQEILANGTPQEISFEKLQIDKIVNPGTPELVASATTDLGGGNTARVDITATVKVSDYEPKTKKN